MVKLQHYVPRCYLKNFANSKGQIWVYDKSADNLFASALDGVACERHFYDTEKLDKAVGREQFVEKGLSFLEGEAATVLGGLLMKLAENRFTRLHANERYFLAHFIAVQMLRTREQRIQMQQMLDGVAGWVHSRLSEEVKAASQEQIPPLKISENELAELQGDLLTDPTVLKEHADILDAHFWIILKAVRGYTFLTSDHPACKKANMHKPFRSMSGIRSKGIEIIFPLSPEYCVCLYERTFFEKKLHQFRSVEDRVRELKDPANMDYYNHLQIMRSNRFLFGASDDFTFARTVCTEEPQWRNQSRRRIASDKDSAP